MNTPTAMLRIRRGGAGQQVTEHVIVGYRIPYLPDFLSFPHYVGATDQDRLQEVLAHQQRLVANFWKWKNTAFSLRYVYDGAGSVDIYALARIFAPADNAEALARLLSTDLADLFRGFGYPIDPVDTATLHSVLAPFEHMDIVEIRQQEGVIPVIDLQKGLLPMYVIYPYRNPASTWLPIFEAFLHQDIPCVLNVHVEPTRLDIQEQNGFAETAKLAASLETQERPGPSGHLRAILRDPHAPVVARLFSELQVRLSKPFIVVVQLVGPRGSQAKMYALAQVVGTEIIARSPQETPKEGALPPGFDVVPATASHELDAASSTLTNLLWRPWGGLKEVPPEKKRLPYLTDAIGASAVFRFPVAVRGGIPGIRVRQPLPVFEVIPGEEEGDSIPLGTFAGRSRVVHVPLRAINRHVLVAGSTGSGKTTTCIRIVVELWRRGIPILVIEPTKTEYRKLLASEIGNDLQVFTLGDETVAPFRLNPLEIMPGVYVEQHISYFKEAFKHALPATPFLPSLIEETLYRIYDRKGWRFTDIGQPDETRAMPTLGELYREIMSVAKARGYEARTLQDVQGAVATRLKPFLLGSKGHMLNVARSIPMDVIMSRPTVLELEALSDEEKALVMLFLLIRVHEYVRTTRREKGLQHVTILEEAHRILTQAEAPQESEVAPATGAAAAGMFTSMLSEIRAYGEGIIIAEQIPRRLAEDAVKNTNVKIVHQLPGEDDRRVLGASMGLTEEQENYVAKLRPGWAAFFTEGYERPTFIYVHKYPEKDDLPDWVDNALVKAHMSAFYQEHGDLHRPFAGCAFCATPCTFRDRIALVAYERDASDGWRAALYQLDQAFQAGDQDKGWSYLVEETRRRLQPLGLEDDVDAAYCYFTHLWAYDLSEYTATEFKRRYKV